MTLFERLLGGSRAQGIERALRERFRFLEERQGFELAESRALSDGALAAYRNRPARRALVVFAREGRGAWAGSGALADDGTLRPLNREALRRGEWRELRRVDLGAQVRTLDDAVAGLARALGGPDG